MVLPYRPSHCGVPPGFARRSDEYLPTGRHPAARRRSALSVPRSPRPLFRAGLAVVATAVLGALPVVTPRPPLAEATTSAPLSRAPGYWLAGGDGSIYAFGSASDRGS